MVLRKWVGAWLRGRRGGTLGKSNKGAVVGSVDRALNISVHCWIEPIQIGFRLEHTLYREHIQSDVTRYKTKGRFLLRLVLRLDVDPC